MAAIQGILNLGQTRTKREFVEPMGQDRPRYRDLKRAAAEAILKAMRRKSVFVRYRGWAGAAFGLMAFVQAGLAQSAEPVVLELFTSQGCGNCPPADEQLAKLGARNDIIALTYNITYWNNYGWRDRLSKDVFTARQRRYAENDIGPSVYTPQMVIDGTENAIGNNKNRILASLEKCQEDEEEKVQVTLVSFGQRLRIILGAAPVRTREPEELYEIWLIPYKAQFESTIEKGENAGRKLTYTNVARGVELVGTWNGMPKEFVVGAPADDPLTFGHSGFVVLVQLKGQGKIIGAKRLALHGP